MKTMSFRPRQCNTQQCKNPNNKKDATPNTGM
jgi:hypothetical protein